MKKGTKILLIGLAALFIICTTWFFTGFRGGWLPGKYDPEAKAYRVWLMGKAFKATSNGIACIRLYNPFGSKSDSTHAFKAYLGAIDSTGRVIVPAVHDSRSWLGLNSRFIVFGKDSLKCLLDTKTQKIVIPRQYKDIELTGWKNEHAFVVKNAENRCGLADSIGKIIVSCKYLRYYTGTDLVMFFDNEDSLGRNYPDIYNLTGRLICAGEYENIYFTEPDMPFFIGRKNNKEGYLVNKQTGEGLKMDFALLNAVRFLDSLIVLAAIPTNKIEEVIPWYDSGMVYEEKRVRTPSGKSYDLPYAISDIQGNIILPPYMYNLKINSFRGVMIVKKDGRAGVLSKTGKWIVPLGEYNLDVLDGLPLAAVWSKPGSGKYWRYFVDLDGNVVVPMEWRMVDISKIGDFDGWLHYVRDKEVYELTYDNDTEQFVHQVITENHPRKNTSAPSIR